MVEASADNFTPYPHIKVTRERFSRILATRQLEDDDADYFGAFLTKTAVRILIDFLNRTFRLRSCDIEIDGSFSVPCTQHFRKRCVAPCVAELCSQTKHAEIANAVRLFLGNDPAGFQSFLTSKIEHAASQLEFEEATYWRDVMHSVETFWQNPRWKVWLDDTVDSYYVEEGESKTYVYLVTNRRRSTLGKHVFESPSRVDPAQFLREVIAAMYRHHLPREIRVNMDFPGRKELASELSERFGRAVKITIVKQQAATLAATRALARAHLDTEIDKVRPDVKDVTAAVGDVFGFLTPLRRIESIDVSHILGSGMVAASAIWDRGALRKNEYDFASLDLPTELSAMNAFAAERFSHGRPLPDLVLVDGGRAQMTAAITATASEVSRPFFVAAVKPAGKHNRISHFLTEDGTRIEFDPTNPGHLLLQVLRDEAHELANFVHGEARDARHFYEAFGVRPLIVPIRFVADQGNAEDLRPIVTKHRREPKSRKKRTSTALYRPSKRARSEP